MTAEGTQFGGAPMRKRKQQRSPREQLLRGVSHPLRYRILTCLNDHEWSPKELSDKLAEGLSQVGYHVKVLEDCELVEPTKTVPRRGALEHFYRAISRAVVHLDLVREIPKASRQLLIGEILEEVNDDVNESMATGLYDSGDFHVVRMPMLLDEKGCGDAHDLGDRYVEDMLKVAGESATRLAKGHYPGSFGVTAVLLVFRSAQAEREKKRPRQA